MIRLKTKRVRTKSEIQRVLAKAKAMLAQGATMEVVSRELGVPSSSLYRWRARAATIESAKHPPYKVRDPNEWANASIAFFCREHPPRDQVRSLDAAFKFASWLRWPRNVGHQNAGLAFYLLSYFRRTQPTATNLFEIAPELARLFLESVSIEELRCVFDIDLDLPAFHLPEGIYGHKFDDYDVFASITRLLLWYPNLDNNRQKDVSIRKALFVLQEGGFRHAWPISRSRFNKIWGHAAPAAPFYYIDRFHSRFSWIFDPYATDFIESVDEIISSPREAQKYLLRSCWVIEQLKRRAVLSEVAFPEFPQMPSEPVGPVQLERELLTLMKGYDSGSDRIFIL